MILINNDNITRKLYSSENTLYLSPRVATLAGLVSSSSGGENTGLSASRMVINKKNGINNVGAFFIITYELTTHVTLSPSLVKMAEW